MFGMEFILASLLVYGITNIIVRGAVLESLKETVEGWHIKTEKKLWKKLTGTFLYLSNCPMCTGFWVGAAIGIMYGPYQPWNIIFNGSIYSGTCWLFHCVTTFLGQGNEPERALTVYVHPESNLTLTQNEEDDEDKKDTEKMVLYG